jgi:hypothetical protein
MKAITKILLLALLFTGVMFTLVNSHASAKEAIADIQDRHLSGFDAISVSGSYDVTVTQGSTESVKVEAPAEVMSHIITEVNNGVLKVYNKHDNWSWGNMFGSHHTIIVHVVVKNVNSISLSGSGDVYFKDGLSANSLKLSLGGSGDVSGKVNVKNLESSLTGSGDVRLSGNAENSLIQISGSGDFSARDLSTANTAVHISGSGDARVNASSRVEASVSGSGDIYYTGSAKNVSSSKSGSGDIHRF